MNGAERCARDDERWKQAQANYVADYDDLSAEAAYRKRLAAVIRMYEIEREYKPSLRPVAEVLSEIQIPTHNTDEGARTVQDTNDSPTVTDPAYSENITEAVDLIREHPADALRRSPRQWGRISEHLTQNAAAKQASRVRCAGFGSWGPSGVFQTIYQAEADVFIVYARYVGQPNGDAR